MTKAGLAIVLIVAAFLVVAVVLTLTHTPVPHVHVPAHILRMRDGRHHLGLHGH